jgi:hypothetical protein
MHDIKAHSFQMTNPPLRPSLTANLPIAKYPKQPNRRNQRKKEETGVIYVQGLLVANWIDNFSGV